MVSYGKGLGSRLRVGVRVRIRIRVRVRVGVRVSARVRAEPKALSERSITCEQDWKNKSDSKNFFVFETCFMTTCFMTTVFFVFLFFLNELRFGTHTPRVLF